MRLQVRTGFIGVMPGFDDSQISDDELDDLIEYILARRSNE